MNNFKILLITIYLLPPVNQDTFQYINEVFINIKNSNITYDDIIIVSDFNSDFMPD